MLGVRAAVSQERMKERFGVRAVVSQELMKECFGVRVAVSQELMKERFGHVQAEDPPRCLPSPAGPGWSGPGCA